LHQIEYEKRLNVKDLRLKDVDREYRGDYWNENMLFPLSTFNIIMEVE